MKKILNKHERLVFLILILTIVQVLSAIIFLTLSFDATFWYIFTGVFKYSEIQIRALEVAGFMQLPALTFWFLVFIISIQKEKTNDT